MNISKLIINMITKGFHGGERLRESVRLGNKGVGGVMHS